MKRTNITTTILLFLLLAVAETVKAQGYQSYFGADSTRLNVYVNCTDYDKTYLLTINQTDTVCFNNQCYLRGFQRIAYNVFEYVYFREDTVTGRLYRYFPMTDEERLLCDMSLMVGDTFSYNNFYGPHQVVVESVSFENGKKVIHFSSWDNLVFHEGIFPNYLPIGFPGVSFENEYLDCNSFLLCEYKDGEQVFDNPYYDSCYEHVFTISEKQEDPTMIYPTKLFPTETLHIETRELILEVVLYDLLGRKVPINSQKSSYRWNVTIPDCISGIYIVKTITEKGLYYEKILIHN